MKVALDRGPDFVPEGLFEGSRAAQFRALKAYANTISHARYAALENSFPKTREAIGKEAFHALASEFLVGEVLNRPLRLIGAGFADLVAHDDSALADLADSEWAMLLAHGAADAPALSIEEIRKESPESLIEISVLRHPAVQIVKLRNPSAFPGEHDGEGPLLLVTRPAVEVRFACIGEDEAALLAMASSKVTLGTLLEANGAAVMPLIQHGALRRAGEQD